MGGYRTALMAKIEKPAAVDRLDEIIELADGIMVARGDLGVELNPEEVPPLQKRIVAPPGAPASRWWSRRRCSNR
jgi:pyruvate kinase